MVLGSCRLVFFEFQAQGLLDVGDSSARQNNLSGFIADYRLRRWVLADGSERGLQNQFKAEAPGVRANWPVYQR